MTMKTKPLDLAVELAKLARSAEPQVWLRDAQVSLDAFSQTTAAAINVGFSTRISAPPLPELGLQTNEGSGGFCQFATYSLAAGEGVKFSAHRSWQAKHPKVMNDRNLETEQKFIEHLLGVLCCRLEVKKP